MSFNYVTPECIIFFQTDKERATKRYSRLGAAEPRLKPETSETRKNPTNALTGNEYQRAKDQYVKEKLQKVTNEWYHWKKEK
jgi:hypothetical protein